jgi:hypothetical protein
MKRDDISVQLVDDEDEVLDELGELENFDEEDDDYSIS